MKINDLKINAFGKLKDKEIKFSDGINIVFGENEAGKSSMQKFISGMLYGISKNKNGKDISDFDKYKPWNTDIFSGKIEYTLDNGKSFEVYREFKKKNPVIYNDQKEDISKDFIIDKTRGIDFFVEQTGIDETTFYSTAITEQEGIKLSKSSQNSVVQKISNLVDSGDDSISYKKTLDKITRLQNEEVGTSRTSQRPLNLVENKISSLLKQKSNLEGYKDDIYDNTSRRENLIINKKFEEKKEEFLRDVKTKLDNNRLKNAEINFNKNLENDYDEKIKELNKKISEHDSNKKYDKVNNKTYIIAISILIILFFVLLVFLSNKLISLVILVPIIFLVYNQINQNKNIKKQMQNHNYEYEKIVNEIDILRKSKESKLQEANETKLKFDSDKKREKDLIIEKYINTLDIGYMNNIFEKDYDEILKEIDNQNRRINTLKFEIQTIDATISSMNSKLKDLSRIEEELQDSEEEKDELVSLNNSYNIAKECLERAYNKVKENISPRFIKNLSDIISKISKERYQNIVLNDVEGLCVEISNGSYVPVSRLSVGTVDQMYLSLRLSALNEITDESMPIILDEAFAYFDDDRLENILKYIRTNFKNNQIIIFTCSKREEEILNKLNIDYNKCILN